MSYATLLQGIRPANLVAHWRLNETNGTAVADSSGNGHNGTATAVTWGAPGVGDGATAGSFDGTTSWIDIFSAGLASAFNPLAGTLLITAQVANRAAWSDATIRYGVVLYANSTNRLHILKSSTDNMLYHLFYSGGAFQNINYTISPDTGWHTLALTWDKAADEVKAFWDGAQAGATLTGIGTWSGTISVARIGDQFTTPARRWAGQLAHCALWNVALTPDEIAQLDPMITDRAAADLTGHTYKAYWNVADWTRVKRATTRAAAQLDDLMGVTVAQNTLTTPTLSTIPAADDINDLVENIDRVRVAAAVSLPALTYNYTPGNAGPDYVAINAWEQTLESLHTLIPAAADTQLYCGVGGAGQDRVWQARFR